MNQEVGRLCICITDGKRILFEDMLDRYKKKDYVDCATAKGENFSAEALFLVYFSSTRK
jgi:hypothetical protein